MAANDEEIPFTWKTKEFLKGHENSDTSWASQVADVDERIKD